MASIIGYVKYKIYILTIETNNYEYIYHNINNDKYKIKNPEYATYVTYKFKILKIEDLAGINYDQIDYIIKDYKLNHEYTFSIMQLFYINRNVAFNLDFLILYNHREFPNGYAGVFRDYYANGQLWMEFFHINGQIHGEYKEYNELGMLEKICNYINGKIEGEYLEYYSNGSIMKKFYYLNNNLHGICKVYYRDGFVKSSEKYVNGEYLMKW